MNRDNKLIYSLYFFIQVILSFFLYRTSRVSFYSEKMISLIVPCLLIVVLLTVSFGFFRMGITKKGFLNKMFLFFCFIFIGYGFIYSFKVIQAVRYNNSYELLNLSSSYSIKDAKKIKNNIEKIFEYDVYGVLSRNIKISNFYEDQDYSVLYIDDCYNNYRLKFYVLLEDYKIKDVYWNFDGYKLYFVRDYKKTSNFEYYYAMYIVNNVYGEEVNYDDSLTLEIEKQISNKFDSSANIMFNYEELSYDEFNDTFSILGNVYCMDYYGDMKEKKFKIEFKGKSSDYVDDNKYYGDFSFRYIDWNISM